MNRKILSIQVTDLNMMISPPSVFYLMLLFFGEMTQKSHQLSSVRQDRVFISTNVGESVTLQCFYEGEVVARFYWYKQTLGEKPRLISSFYSYDKNGTFYDECENNPRFTLSTEKAQNHLTITDVQVSDSATYFCASSFSVSFEFAEGITVSVKGSGSNSRPLIQQSASKTIQPGGSVTLNCTVHTGTCDEEHSVYWFRNSEESHSGLIYSHGGRNDECERKPKTHTNTCVYSLPMKNLDVSHAGIYYCAVASCGYMLFGNGTELDFGSQETFLLSVYFLIAALAFTTILIFILAFLIYGISRRQCTGSNARFSASSITNTENCEPEETLHYAALRVKKTSRSTRKRENPEDKCLYSSIK
ncbi:immunoglobulin kappa light chain-like isoform X1 [Simochromis diagramma]|uniref:immunoglobulin kappa light chain-like isoform X1 n=1 Tax=Simochromis diagramma TaxID=43689 RepID=UPI001A7E8A35|nr:immunoglobulin kappa light chain-like isoform X1 [Simochromis diagramma]